MIFYENSPLKAQDKRGSTILKSHSFERHTTTFERVQIEFITEFANVYGYAVWRRLLRLLLFIVIFSRVLDPTPDTDKDNNFTKDWIWTFPFITHTGGYIIILINIYYRRSSHKTRNDLSLVMRATNTTILIYLRTIDGRDTSLRWRVVKTAQVCVECRCCWPLCSIFTTQLCYHCQSIESVCISVRRFWIGLVYARTTRPQSV